MRTATILLRWTGSRNVWSFVSIGRRYEVRRSMACAEFEKRDRDDDEVWMGPTYDTIRYDTIRYAVTESLSEDHQIER